MLEFDSFEENGIPLLPFEKLFIKDSAHEDVLFISAKYNIFFIYNFFCLEV